MHAHIAAVITFTNAEFKINSLTFVGKYCPPFQSTFFFLNVSVLFRNTYERGLGLSQYNIMKDRIEMRRELLPQTTTVCKIHSPCRLTLLITVTWKRMKEEVPWFPPCLALCYHTLLQSSLLMVMQWNSPFLVSPPALASSQSQAHARRDYMCFPVFCFILYMVF